jgi:hypothetical protein
MVYIPLQNGDGQVLEGIRLKSPENEEYVVVSSSRKGINRYELILEDDNGEQRKVMNHELRNKWSIVGDWFTPEELAEKYNTKVDPDANKPRPMRESFWKMRSKKGTFNYKQKVRLMEKPEYQVFKEYFDTTIEK